MATTDDDHEIKTEEESVADVTLQPDHTVPMASDTPISDVSPVLASIKPPSIRTMVPRRRPKPQKSWGSWMLSNTIRLFVWYTIVTIVFRCPSEPSELTNGNPRLCRPYMAAKRYTLPHVEPYYDVYARPYVDKGMPYVATAQARVLQPVSNLLVKNYRRFAAPQLAYAQGYLASQGDKYVRPYLENATHSVRAAYDNKLSHHVQHISELATPYYGTVKHNANHAYRSHILPAVAHTQPQLQRAWSLTKRFILETVYPFAKHAGTYAVIFVEGTVWPTIKHIYINNVRPQLVMISERVSTYQEGKKLQSVMEQVDSSISSSLSSVLTNVHADSVTSISLTTIPMVSSMSSITSSLSSSILSPSSTGSTAAIPSTAQAEHQIDDLVAADLAKWHKKFSVAAETAVQDLRERIAEIVHSMARVDVSEGENLKSALTKTIEVELDTLRLKMRAITDSTTDGRRYTKQDQNNVNQAIRSYGQQIKNRAQAVRSWADSYSAALDERVNLATDSTLHVLDDIRDLGLQDLGTRWAKLEGMTYKHWRDYHDLKKAFARERGEIRNQSMQHPALIEAHNEIKRVLEEAMATTEDAVDKLVEAKERVAAWQLDDSGVGMSKDMPIADRAKNAAEMISERFEDVMTVLKDKATDTASSVLLSVSPSGSNPSSASSLAVDGASSLVESVTAQASSHVSGSQDSPRQHNSDDSGSLESIVTEVSSILPTATLRLESVIPHASSSISSAASKASDVGNDILSEASSVVLGDSTASIESLTSSVISASNSISSDVSSDASSSANHPKRSATDSIVEDPVAPVSAATEPASLVPSHNTASEPSVVPDLAASIRSKASSVKAAIAHASGSASSSISSVTQHKKNTKDQFRQQEL